MQTWMGTQMRSERHCGLAQKRLTLLLRASYPQKSNASASFRSMVPKRWLLLGLMAWTMGCGGSEPWENPGPRETFQTFLMDMWRGQTEAAYGALSPELRDALEGPLAMLGDHIEQGALPEREEMFVVARLDNPFDLHRMEIEDPVREPPEVGRRVTLKLQYHDGRTGQAALLWGGDRWYIDLAAPRQPEPDEDTDG